MWQVHDQRLFAMRLKVQRECDSHRVGRSCGRARDASDPSSRGLRAAPLQVRVTGGLQGRPVPLAPPSPALLPVALSDSNVNRPPGGKTSSPLKY